MPPDTVTFVIVAFYLWLIAGALSVAVCFARYGEARLVDVLCAVMLGPLVLLLVEVHDA